MATVADAWRPTSELEHRLQETVRAGDQEGYFRLLADSELVVPVPPELVDGVLANETQPSWPTQEEDGRVHVLAYTSASAMRACLGPSHQHFMTVRFGDIAETWPDARWWLAIDAPAHGVGTVLPIEARMPAWFIRQVAEGDGRPPQVGRAAPWEELRDQHRDLPRQPPRPEFQPANDVERELLRAAANNDHDLFLQTLAATDVLLPVPDDTDFTLRPGRPGFPWQTREVDGATVVPVFTSPERLHEASGAGAEYIKLPFTVALRYWPNHDWLLAINSGSPAGGTVLAQQLPGLATWADQRAARRMTEHFEPQNDIEQRLFDAARRRDTDAFSATLLGAQVLVPADADTPWGIVPGDPDFPWRPVPVHGRTSIQVFTSLKWMNEAIGSCRFIMPSLHEMAAAWPDAEWTLVLNPGTPIDTALPGDQIRTLRGPAAPPSASTPPHPEAPAVPVAPPLPREGRPATLDAPHEGLPGVSGDPMAAVPSSSGTGMGQDTAGPQTQGHTGTPGEGPPGKLGDPTAVPPPGGTSTGQDIGAAQLRGRPFDPGQHGTGGPGAGRDPGTGTPDISGTSSGGSLPDAGEATTAPGATTSGPHEGLTNDTSAGRDTGGTQAQGRPSTFGGQHAGAPGEGFPGRLGDPAAVPRPSGTDAGQDNPGAQAHGRHLAPGEHHAGAPGAGLPGATGDQTAVPPPGGTNSGQDIGGAQLQDRPFDPGQHATGGPGAGHDPGTGTSDMSGTPGGGFPRDADEATAGPGGPYGSLPGGSGQDTGSMQAQGRPSAFGEPHTGASGEGLPGSVGDPVAVPPSGGVGDGSPGGDAGAAGGAGGGQGPGGAALRYVGQTAAGPGASEDAGAPYDGVPLGRAGREQAYRDPAAAARAGEQPGGRGLRAVAEPEPVFEPGNRIDQELYETASGGDSDAFLRVLLNANVLVPIPDEAPLEVTPMQRDFRWDAALRGEAAVQVFTSLVRLREVLPESRFVYADFRELIGAWPRDDWAMLINPGTRIGASLQGDQVRALSEWAVRVGLVPARPEVPLPPPRPEPEPEPAAAQLPADLDDRVSSPTIMQKVVPHGHVAWYLEQGYDRAGGFVHSTGDVAELQTPAQLYEALGLLYDGSPFSPADDGVYVIRWPAYCPDLYRVPFGGRDEAELAAWGESGWVIERPPFLGGGFAPGSAGSIREYKVDSVRLPYGAEMYYLGRDRSERFVAMYDPDRLAWLRPEAGPEGWDGRTEAAQ